jgi:cytochrome c
MIARGCALALGAALALSLVAPVASASEFIDLVKAGDVAAVTSLLDSGTPVDELDGGVTALYVASEGGNVELAQLLVSRGADVNITVKLQRTPLYGAVKAGHADVVKLLLDSGADPNKVAKLQTPLHVAAETGCLQCVIDLVGAGAEVNALLKNGSPPIHLAKRSGHEDIVAYLLEHGGGPPEVAPISSLLASANAEQGKHTFDEVCVACHIATAEPETSKRPNLWDIVGRVKASESDVAYSPELKAAGGAWTYEELNAFLAHPPRTLPGTEMNYAGLESEQARADLIAYLRSLSNAPVPLP